MRRKSPRTARWFRSRSATTLPDVTSISIPGQRKSQRAGRVLQDSGRHAAERRQPHQDAEDQQCDRDRGSRRQALQRDQGSQSHRRRLRRLTRSRKPEGRILMASTIRVRATSSGDTTEVQALIQHPMDSGFVKDAKGDMIPPHFIQQLTFEYDGKAVFVADWGPAVSKDPYVKFCVQGRQEGRRPEDQLGRQQGRDRHHHGEDPVSGGDEPVRSAIHLASAALAVGRAGAWRPRRPPSPPTRRIRRPTPRRSRTTSPRNSPR